jgi:hypothetical protein
MKQNISYILLDAARMDPEIITAKELNPRFDSLYRGRSEESLSSVAPYLFTLDKETEFRKWYFDKGWGDSWGVLVYSSEDLKTLVKHFRQFLMVKTEDGEELYFRFYDPRVLRVFLPTCDSRQLKEFFGPVDYFICEDEDPTFADIYCLNNYELVASKITKEEVLTFNPVITNKHRFSFF